MTNSSAKVTLEWLFLIALFLLPPLVFSTSLPAIYGTDLLLPFVCLFLLSRRNEIPWSSFKGLLIVTGAYCFAIVASIAVNGRWAMIQDWFELYKVLKFLLIAFYAAVSMRDSVQLDRIMKFCFAGLVVFNVLHYFNLFGFNEHVIRYYTGYIQLSNFGVNSLGQPDTRRILGTVGNPNNNAILLLFFVIWFAKSTYSNWDKTWFYLSVFLVLACQSRTGLAATIAVLILATLYFRWKGRQILIDFGVYTLMYLVLFFGGSVYLSSLGNLGFIQRSFEHGRIEMWTKLLRMWKERPVFGFAPSKDVFYKNHWYSEGEYVLMLWRYGIIGCVIYLSWLFYPVFKVVRNLRQRSIAEFRWLAFTLVLIVGGITNNPTLDFALLLQFAILAGLALAPTQEKEAVA